jgi:hypothetical protein
MSTNYYSQRSEAGTDGWKQWGAIRRNDMLRIYDEGDVIRTCRVSDENGKACMENK